MMPFWYFRGSISSTVYPLIAWSRAIFKISVCHIIFHIVSLYAEYGWFYHHFPRVNPYPNLKAATLATPTFSDILVDSKRDSILPNVLVLKPLKSSISHHLPTICPKFWWIQPVLMDKSSPLNHNNSIRIKSPFPWSNSPLNHIKSIISNRFFSSDPPLSCPTGRRPATMSSHGGSKQGLSDSKVVDLPFESGWLMIMMVYDG